MPIFAFLRVYDNKIHGQAPFFSTNIWPIQGESEKVGKTLWGDRTQLYEQISS